MHYLIVYDAEEDEGNWSQEFDWVVEHPDECWQEIETPIYEYEFGPARNGWKEIVSSKVVGYDKFMQAQCGIEWELDNIGMDTFGNSEEERLENWPEPPFKVPIKHIVYTYRTIDTYEVDTYIEMVEE